MDNQEWPPEAVPSDTHRTE